MTLTAGTRLGPYEIVAPIGAGGMGEVYHGRARSPARRDRESPRRRSRPHATVTAAGASAGLALRNW